MQLLANGRDQVAQTFQEKQYFLHRLVDGTYQFGEGKTAYVVKSVDEVKMFNDQVQTQVEKWLQSGGYERAMEAKRTLELAESAQGMPGSLEAAILAKGGPVLLGQIHALVTGSKYAPMQAPEQELPPDVVRGPSKAPIVLADEGAPVMPSGLESFQPDHTEMDRFVEQATTAANQSEDQAPPEPANQLQQDILVAVTSLSEAVNQALQRITALESTPQPKPAKKRIRPSRAKAKPKTEATLAR